MPVLDTTPSLHRQLNQLEQADLARLAAAQPEVAYMFRHALVQESAYHTMEHGDPAAAEPHRPHARDLLEGIIAHIPTPELRAPFLARPDLRELFAGSASAASSGRPPAPGQPAPPV